MLLTLDVVLPTPHDNSGTFQKGYTSRLCSLKEESEGSKKGQLCIPGQHMWSISYYKCRPNVLVIVIIIMVSVMDD